MIKRNRENNYKVNTIEASNLAFITVKNNFFFLLIKKKLKVAIIAYINFKAFYLTYIIITYPAIHLIY